MANRRSLGDAMTMTPDKRAFIQGANSSIEKEEATSPANPLTIAPRTGSDQSGKSTEESLDAPSPSDRRGVSLRSSARRSKVRSRANREPQEDSIMLGMADLLVPLTTRLQPATAIALKRAGLEQRLNGKQPATVQEIVEIAVSEWLEEYGYLKAHRPERD